MLVNVWHQVLEPVLFNREKLDPVIAQCKIQRNVEIECKKLLIVFGSCFDHDALKSNYHNSNKEKLLNKI